VGKTFKENYSDERSPKKLKNISKEKRHNTKQILRRYSLGDVFDEDEDLFDDEY